MMFRIDIRKKAVLRNSKQVFSGDRGRIPDE